MIDRLVIWGIVTFALIGFGVFVLAAGMGYDHGVVQGYGCGRHDASQTARSDPAEYDLPPCAEIRKLWEASERWPK